MGEKAIHTTATMAAAPDGYRLLRADEFHDRVIASGDPVVIEFWADWCGPCNAMVPYVAKLAVENADLVTFYRVNVDREPKLAQQLAVRHVPTLLFFGKGCERARIIGYATESIIAKEIARIRK